MWVVSFIKERQSGRLVNSNAPALLLLSLRNSNAQDSILEIRSHSLLVDGSRKAEGPGELAHGALANPELLLGFLFLLLRVSLGDLGSLLLGLLGVLVLDGGLVRTVAIFAVGDRGGGAAALDEAGWWCAGSVGALGAARDDDGLGLGELDGDVVFLGAGNLSVEFVAGLGLLHVETRGECGELSRAAAVRLASGRDLVLVAVEVVEQPE